MSDEERRSLARLAGEGDLTAARRLVSMLEREVTVVTKVDELGCGKRLRKALWRLNIESVEDLLKKSEAELFAVKNFGPETLRELIRLVRSADITPPWEEPPTKQPPPLRTVPCDFCGKLVANTPNAMSCHKVTSLSCRNARPR